MRKTVLVAAAAAVHQPEHRLLHRLVGPRRQHLGVLERGGDDLAVAPAPEDVEQPRLDVALARRLVRQVPLFEIAPRPAEKGAVGEPALGALGTVQRPKAPQQRSRLGGVEPACGIAANRARGGVQVNPVRSVSGPWGRVDLGPAAGLGHTPLGTDPAALLDPVDCRVERALLDLKQFVRQLPKALDDAVAVERSQAESLQDKQVERALQEIRLQLSQTSPPNICRLLVTPRHSMCRVGRET